MCLPDAHRHHIHQCITRIGRTVKPFHNGNRCVTRSGTCGNLPQEQRPRRRSNQSQPQHPFDLFKVGPSFGVFSAGGASRATQRFAMVGQLRRPYASYREFPFIVQPGGHAGPPLQRVCRMTPQTWDANANVGADRCVCPMYTDTTFQRITQTSRTVEPFHNGNRCVTRSGTCGDLPQNQRPRRRSNRSQPRHPFDLFKVGPSLAARPQVAHSRATQRLAMVGQLRRPYASWNKIKAVLLH